MSDIQVGNVLIRDVNQNDLFDSSDSVHDPQGQPLSPQEIQVRLKDTLKSLGAKSWANLWLSDASSYLENFKAADQASLQGKVEETRTALQSAAEAQKNLPIPFDQARADGLMKRALNLSIPQAFQEADRIAQAGGEIAEVKGHLDRAEAAVDELNHVFGIPAVFDRVRADGILKAAYQNGIPALYTEAENLAKSGDIDSTRFELARVQIFIREANQFYALNLSFDQARADQAMKEAYFKGIPPLYLQAEKLARKGQTQRVRQTLTALQRHIQDANQTYGLNYAYDQGRADRIMEDALIFGIEDNFKLASRYAKGRNLSQARQWLKRAKDYVDEYNQNYAPRKNLPPFLFDQHRAAAIEACAQGKGPCF